MTINYVKRGISREKRAAKAHNAKHIGGPGKEDYIRGTVKGEVKTTKSKMTKPTMMKCIKEKGITEFDVTSGYTKPALQYCKRYRPEVKLIVNNHVVKPRIKTGGK